MPNEVRRNQLARVHLDDRHVQGVIQEVREDAPGHERVLVEELGENGEAVDTSVDRVEVVECS